MIEEEIDVEFLVAHHNAMLAAHKCEPDTEFEKELAQVVKQASLQIALVHIVAGGEKIEVVVIFGDVPREVGSRARKVRSKFAAAFPCRCKRPDSIW